MTLLDFSTIRKSWEQLEKTEKSYKHRPEHHLYACLVCARPLTQKAADSSWWVHLVNGGSHLAPLDWEPETTDDRCGDVGWFPVGSECAKLVPGQYRQKG